MASDEAVSYSIRTRDLNLWYGDFQALNHIEVNIRHTCVTALIGPSGCGKTTPAALLQPHQRALRQRDDHRRNHDPRQEHLRRRRLARPSCARRWAWSFSGPIRCRSRFTRTCCSASACTPSAAPFSRSERDAAGRVGPAGRLSVEGRQGPAAQQGHAADARAAAEAVHRPAAAAQAARDPDGRALLGPGRRGDAGHRVADRQPAAEIHDRRSSRTTWARPPGPARSASICCWARWSNTARLRTSFCDPQRKETEMYIEGRYG